MILDNVQREPDDLANILVRVVPVIELLVLGILFEEAQLLTNLVIGWL